MKKITYISICVGVLIIIIVSFFYCEPSEEYEVSFSHDIQPIFNTKCMDCHGAGGSANLDLSSYSSIMSGENENSPVLIPYQADQSLLYEKVSQQSPSIGDRMPFGRDPLITSDIKLIGDWIDQGAKDN
ncbi:MAG: hypothetical protein KAT41_00765 [Candidatus Marinimicrobia bacterium]|nr:hypothetical protein [Candidatus Neomarinimicrobiota bacterium]